MVLLKLLCRVLRSLSSWVTCFCIFCYVCDFRGGYLQRFHERLLFRRLFGCRVRRPGRTFLLLQYRPFRLSFRCEDVFRSNGEGRFLRRFVQFHAWCVRRLCGYFRHEYFRFPLGHARVINASVRRFDRSLLHGSYLFPMPTSYLSRSFRARASSFRCSLALGTLIVWVRCG